MCAHPPTVQFGESLHRHFSPKLSVFSPPGSTCRCLFTEPFNGFTSTFGQSTRLTTDSLAQESTVMSRYRPPLTICFNRFAVDGHVADRDGIQLYLVSRPIFTRRDFNLCCVRLTYFFHCGCHNGGGGRGGRSRDRYKLIVCTQFLTCMADKAIHRGTAFRTGKRLQCTRCPRVQLQQCVRVLLPPFPAAVFSSTSSRNHSSHGTTSIRTFVRSTFFLTGDVVLGSCNWQMLVVYAQFLRHRTKQGSSLRNNLSRWIHTSIHSVPKGPPASKYQTAHAS